jgi:hypothetical protein
MRLCVLLLVANWSAGPLGAATGAATGPGGGYNTSGGKKLLFRRPGPKGKG